MSFHTPAHKQPATCPACPHGRGFKCALCWPAVNPPTPHDALTLFVQREAAKHPELKLSFGYIGNVYRDGTDDRSWRVFTNRRDYFGHSVSYHLGDTKNLGDALQSLPFRWAAFVERALSNDRSY
jgi:hypothetical protein